MRGFIRIWSGAIVVLGVASPVFAQVHDPYAGDMRKIYEQHKEQFIQIGARIYFADECGALPDRVQAPMLVTTLGNGLIEEAAQARAPLPDRRLLDEAKRRGVAMARSPGACTYWHKHPEAVAALRRLGTALESNR
jgi:hypothetical protein